MYVDPLTLVSLALVACGAGVIAGCVGLAAALYWLACKIQQQQAAKGG